MSSCPTSMPPAISATGPRPSTALRSRCRSSRSSSARPSNPGGTQMQTNLRGRDLISLQEWTREEIDTVLEVAARLKMDRALRPPPAPGGGGTTYRRAVAQASRVPVLNMQCDLFHPHQILADLLTMKEKKGDLRGKTITVSWAYAASYQKPLSVPLDLTLASTRFGMNVRLVHPPEYKLPQEYVDQAAENARMSGGSLELMDDFDAGFKGSEVVYAKSWGPLLVAKSDEEGAEIGKKYTDWITDERRMAMAAEDAIYMHPLPADRNVEVADAVIDGPHSVVYDEAENRLHAQKAVMALTMR